MVQTELFLAVVRVRFLLLYHLHNIGKEAARHELVSVQGRTAVRALGSRLLYPFLNAALAGELRAVRAHHCVLNHIKADEATEKFVKLHRSVPLQGGSRCSCT